MGSLLPGFPFHMHTWPYLKQVEYCGHPFAPDAVTRSRTQPSTAKVRVKVDLLKPQPETVWVGLEDENSPPKGYVPKT